MFRKLVSNLPFSPSLIHRVGFYASRLKKEEFTRKLGLLGTILLIIVQSLTIFAPATPTIAASSNDIVFGGGDREELLMAYRSGCDIKGRCDIKQIFDEYGIGEGNLITATYEVIYSGPADNYWLIGRSPRGYGSEVAKPIPNGPSLWSRTLHSWSPDQEWDSLKVHTDQGIRWILTENGSIVTKDTTPQPTSASGKTEESEDSSRVLAVKDTSICPTNSGLPQINPSCPSCGQSVVTPENKNIACLELHKTAKNITQQIADANGTKANPGDVIEYTLSVKNLGKETRKEFVIEENLEDVLEYADIIDASGATFTKSPIHFLSWSPVDIKPSGVVTRTVLIKVKSDIPLTPAAISDPLSHDQKMVNVYGDTVSIELPKSPVKTIEYTVAKLPHTGFGVNVLISIILAILAVYFYLRSRTMRRELLIIRRQFQAGSIIS